MTGSAAAVQILLTQHGRTYADEAGIRPMRNTPVPLFRLLTLSLLLSARIRASTAVRAARALSARGWTSAARMHEATWEDRTQVLNQSGYARYDESTSRMLGETAGLVLREYGGDLRRLRERAGRDPVAERHLLDACKGIGDVGVDIFFREAQVVWSELEPFVDARALRAARRLALPDDPAGLRAEVDDVEAFVRLLAALVRVDLAGSYDEVLASA